MIPLFTKYIWTPIQDLLFPNYCVHCKCIISNSNAPLCYSCHSLLPFTASKPLLDKDTQTLLQTATSILPLLYFIKQGIAQDVIHHLKYNNRTDIGLYLGDMMYQHFKSYFYEHTIAAIIPVPLHAKKQYQRGYNQAQYIAEGLSKASGIPTYNHILLRKKNTASQTQKSKQERLDNVKDAFVAQHNEQIINKHIILIDDVLTTGATLSECMKVLYQSQVAKISIMTAAVAMH